MATRAGSGQTSGLTSSSAAISATHATAAIHGHPTTAAAVHVAVSPPMSNEH